MDNLRQGRSMIRGYNKNRRQHKILGDRKGSYNQGAGEEGQDVEKKHVNIKDI